MFLAVESTHPGSNPRFDMRCFYLWLIILSVIGDVPSIARHQSFGGVFACVHIGECTRIVGTYIYIVF